MPIQPSSPILATISYGKRFSRSSSSADRRHLLHGEVADGLLQQAVVVGEVEVHRAILPVGETRTGSSAAAPGRSGGM